MVGFNKDEIIALSRRVGTHDLSAQVGEYCAMVPTKPATRALLEDIEREEARMDLAILERAIEGQAGAAAMKPPAGATDQVVRDVVARLDRNEYKRRQSPLVLRTSTKAFGSGRRLPIVHRYGV